MTSTSRPIILTAESVRAILAGTKGQTRRVVAQRDGERMGLALHGIAARLAPDVPAEAIVIPPECVRYEVGMRLWVREAWQFVSCAGAPWPESIRNMPVHGKRPGWRTIYRDDDDPVPPSRWLSPRFMPRWASRLTLEVLSVRVERLDAITEEDARAEGAPMCVAGHGPITKQDLSAEPGLWSPRLYRNGFEFWWDTINGRRPGCAWSDNPWVFVISFKRLDDPVPPPVREPPRVST